VQVDAEGAFRQAREAEVAVRRGAKLGALHGVPVSIKSSIEVAGFRCEAGTKLRQGTVASQDAPLVSRLRDAGAIILGTTNTPELLMAWETDNLLYGRTNNPWDLTRTPGGSSGGEAAAIASGMSAGGVGSDDGGYTCGGANGRGGFDACRFSGRAISSRWARVGQATLVEILRNCWRNVARPDDTRT